MLLGLFVETLLEAPTWEILFFFPWLTDIPTISISFRYIFFEHDAACNHVPFKSPATQRFFRSLNPESVQERFEFEYFNDIGDLHVGEKYMHLSVFGGSGGGRRLRVWMKVLRILGRKPPDEGLHKWGNPKSSIYDWDFPLKPSSVFGVSRYPHFRKPPHVSYLNGPQCMSLMFGAWKVDLTVQCQNFTTVLSWSMCGKITTKSTNTPGGWWYRIYHAICSIFHMGWSNISRCSTGIFQGVKAAVMGCLWRRLEC